MFFNVRNVDFFTLHFRFHQWSYLLAIMFFFFRKQSIIVHHNPCIIHKLKKKKNHSPENHFFKGFWNCWVGLSPSKARPYAQEPKSCLQCVQTRCCKRMAHISLNTFRSVFVHPWTSGLVLNLTRPLRTVYIILRYYIIIILLQCRISY